MSNIKSRGSGTVPFALSKGKVLFSERWAGPTTQTINLTLKTCHQQERNITRRTKENQAQSLGKHPCRRHKMWGPQGLFCCHIIRGESLQKRKRSVTSLQNQIQVVMIRTRWLKKTSLVCWKCCSFQVPCCKEEKHLSQDSRGRCCLTRTSFTDQVTDTWCQMTRGKLRFEVEIYALVAVKKYWCCIFMTPSDPTLSLIREKPEQYIRSQNLWTSSRRCLKNEFSWIEHLQIGFPSCDRQPVSENHCFGCF